MHDYYIIFSLYYYIHNNALKGMYLFYLYEKLGTTYVIITYNLLNVYTKFTYKFSVSGNSYLSKIANLS